MHVIVGEVEDEGILGMEFLSQVDSRIDNTQKSKEYCSLYQRTSLHRGSFYRGSTVYVSIMANCSFIQFDQVNPLIQLPSRSEHIHFRKISSCSI